MSAVAVRIYFPSNAILALSTEAQPLSPAAARASPCPTGIYLSPPRCRFYGGLSWRGANKCTGSIRKEIKNQLGCNLTKFAAIRSSLLMIRKDEKLFRSHQFPCRRGHSRGASSAVSGCEGRLLGVSQRAAGPLRAVGSQASSTLRLFTCPVSAKSAVCHLRNTDGIFLQVKGEFLFWNRGN